MVARAALVFVAAMAMPLDAGAPLTMQLSPNVALEPALLTIKATIEADADNRALEIVASSPDYYRSSVIPLDGANAPRLNVVEFKNLPTGTYEVTSILLGATGQRGAVSHLFRVAPAAGSPR